MRIACFRVGTARCAVRNEFPARALFPGSGSGSCRTASLPSGVRLSRKRPRVIFFENIQHQTTSRQVLAVKPLKLRFKISGYIGHRKPFQKTQELGRCGGCGNFLHRPPHPRSNDIHPMIKLCGAAKTVRLAIFVQPRRMPFGQPGNGAISPPAIPHSSGRFRPVASHPKWPQPHVCR